MKVFDANDRTLDLFMWLYVCKIGCLTEKWWKLINTSTTLNLLLLVFVWNQWGSEILEINSDIGWNMWKNGVNMWVPHVRRTVSNMFVLNKRLNGFSHMLIHYECNTFLNRIQYAFLFYENFTKMDQLGSCCHRSLCERAQSLI